MCDIQIKNATMSQTRGLAQTLLHLVPIFIDYWNVHTSVLSNNGLYVLSRRNVTITFSKCTISLLNTKPEPVGKHCKMMV